MKDDLIERIALKINATFEKQGLSVSAIAKKAGVSYMTVKSFRQGNVSNVRVDTLAKMSEAAGIPVEKWQEELK